MVLVITHRFQYARKWNRNVKENSPGGGGHFRNFLVGMCRWDPGTRDQ